MLCSDTVSGAAPRIETFTAIEIEVSLVCSYGGRVEWAVSPFECPVRLVPRCRNGRGKYRYWKRL